MTTTRASIGNLKIHHHGDYSYREDGIVVPIKDRQFANKRMVMVTPGCTKYQLRKQNTLQRCLDKFNHVLDLILLYIAQYIAPLNLILDYSTNDIQHTW